MKSVFYILILFICIISITSCSSANDAKPVKKSFDEITQNNDAQDESTSQEQENAINNENDAHENDLSAYAELQYDTEESGAEFRHSIEEHGNITNSGRVAFYDEWIYYINTNDSNNLYRMKKDGTGQIKINNGVKANRVSIAEGSIYFSGDGIYRMNLDGTDKTLICNDSVACFEVEDDWIYYFSSDDKSIYKIKTDGTGKMLVHNDFSYNINVDSGWIYYDSYKDGKLYRICIDGSEKEVLYNDQVYEFIVSGRWIYYCSNQAAGLCRMRIDGSESEIFIDERIGRTFNIDNECIYYESYGFYKMKIDSKEKIKLSDRSALNIGLAYDKIIYFYHGDEDSKEIESVNMIDKNGTSDTYLVNAQDESTSQEQTQTVQEGKNPLDYNGTENEESIHSAQEHGNNSNYGRVAYYDDWIYFINSADRYALYRMKKDSSELGKINDDTYEDTTINISNNFIYILIDSIHGNGGIYRMNLDGSDKTLICDDDVYSFEVEGDWIYYCDSYYQGIYKIKTDGTSKTFLYSDFAFDINVDNGWIYYNSTRECMLFRLKTDGSKRETVCTDSVIEFIVNGDWIYYAFSQEELPELYKIKTDGRGKKKLVDKSENFKWTFNMDDEWIYYSANGLKKMKIDGSSKMMLSTDKSVDFIGLAYDKIIYYYYLGTDEFGNDGGGFDGFEHINVINKDGSFDTCIGKNEMPEGK